MNIFEQALKNKYRFETINGFISTEDLFDLPLTGKRVNLDSVAKTLNRKLKELEEESFVKPKANDVTVLQMKLDIVKHIIKLRLDELEASKSAAEKKERNQKILEIMKEKEDEGLRALSKEDLEKLLAE